MLKSLYRRPRGRRIAALLNLATGGHVAEIPTSPPFDLALREIEPTPVVAGEVTQRLRALIDEGDLAELHSRLTPGARRELDDAAEGQRPFLELALCVHLEIDSVLEKTHLVSASPPEDVHAMGRGETAAGGSYYYADLVIDGLRAGGGTPSQCRRALDFGCSSGRVVRVLAAAYPEIEWSACDPNEAAIAWARSHLRDVSFELSPTSPPLVYPDESFDLAFAISVWSHFDESAAGAWLAEMGRIIRPNGYLVLTTHGFQSVAHYARSAAVSRPDLDRATEAMYRRGFWFVNDWFAGGSDYGVRNDAWGTSFISPEWMLANAPPTWALVGFEPGRAEGNQDLYVLWRKV